MTFERIYSGNKSGGKPVISFEIFPPKTPEGMDNLSRTLDELAALSPGFISVTYGAMGTTRENSFEIASRIKEMGIETASHLTCVGSSSGEIERILGELRERGIENIVALRGDPPGGGGSFVAEDGGYSYANELVSHIRDFDKRGGGKSFGVAVAGYPEKHTEAESLEKDIENLAKKTRAGADVVITQLFYDNAFYFDYLQKARSAGIETPVVPGLMPIVSAKQVVKTTSMCGSSIPKGIMAQLEECEKENRSAEDVGVNVCAAQAEELLEKGAPGIHFYVLNRAAQVKAVLNRLGL
ncbi:MAG: methylenetetrahydrofolate reductase [NAD(P)H] [Thermodesulfobacteriota bacterium]